MEIENTSWGGVWENSDIERGMVVCLYKGNARVVQASLVPTDDIDEWRLVTELSMCPTAFSKAELVNYLNRGKFKRVA